MQTARNDEGDTYLDHKHGMLCKGENKAVEEDKMGDYPNI